MNWNLVRNAFLRSGTKISSKIQRACPWFDPLCNMCRNRFDTVFGPSYDGIVVHSFKNKVGEYLERMARWEDWVSPSDKSCEKSLRTKLTSEVPTSFDWSHYIRKRIERLAKKIMLWLVTWDSVMERIERLEQKRMLWLVTCLLYM
jgi:hypothetical protein